MLRQPRETNIGFLPISVSLLLIFYAHEAYHAQLFPLAFIIQVCLKIFLPVNCLHSLLYACVITHHMDVPLLCPLPPLPMTLRLFPIFYNHKQCCDKCLHTYAHMCGHLFPHRCARMCKHPQDHFPQVEWHPRMCAFTIFVAIAKLPSGEVIPQIPFKSTFSFSL